MTIDEYKEYMKTRIPCPFEQHAGCGFPCPEAVDDNCTLPAYWRPRDEQKDKYRYLYIQYLHDAGAACRKCPERHKKCDSCRLHQARIIYESEGGQ